MDIQSALENWIESDIRLLDLGCGDGTILLNLKNKKGIKGLGVEIKPENIQKCLEKGVNVIEHNIDKGLASITSESFDVVLMSQTIQALNNPNLALSEITRIGKRCIVTIPNFGNWKSRLTLLFKGKMPITNPLKETWYSTQNIHLCTLKDFESLCSDLEIVIDEKKVINSKGRTGWYLYLLPNLLGSSVMYKIRK